MVNGIKKMPPLGRNYQSPPGSNSNDGATPTVYDPSWQTYTNLTPNQTAWFSSQPQFLIFYAQNKRWQKEVASGPLSVTLSSATVVVNTDVPGQAYIAHLKQMLDNGTYATATIPFVDSNGVTHTISVVDVKTLFTAVHVNRVQGSWVALKSAIDQINAGTITSTTQVDAIINAVP